MKAALLFVMLFGQEIADEKAYQERMRDISHSFVVLQEYRKGRSTSEDEESAGFARMAKEGAEKAREAAKNKEEKALQASIEAVARSCEGCHREPLDKYRILKK
jgi:hypothetical protein